ncbi:MAG: CoA transferase [Pseudomonadota bacterium]
MSQQVLSGVRVVDFSRYIAGPYCATLLGHLGADVVRVEKRGGAEDRHVTPLQSSGESIGALFQQTGANKRSLTLDIKHPEARSIIEKLVAGADVVIANMPPAALQRAGLDYETISKINPRVILTTQTGYGHLGPWANRGGFDGVGQAMSGAAYFAGEPDQPVKSAAPYADFGTALFGAYATLAALIERDRTGKGQHIQASLLGTALALFNPLLTEHAATGIERQPTGARSQTSAPSSIFKTADGHVLIHVVGEGLFARAAKAIGADGWIEDPRFAGDQARGDHSAEICRQMSEWCGHRTSAEVLEVLNQTGVPCGPVLPIAEVLEHEQIKAMQLVNGFSVPGLEGEVPVVDFPVSMSESDVGHKRRAPMIGEHSVEILEELGFSTQNIAHFEGDGVI